MIRSIAGTAIAVSALALLAACGPKSDNPSQQPSANPEATIPSPIDETAAPVFVQKAVANDIYELQAAQVALARTRDKDIKAYAQMIVAGHTKSANDLKAAIAASGLALAPLATLPAELVSKIEALSNTSASAFDKAYVGQQVEAHQSTLDVVQRYANDGDTPSIKAFAAAFAPVVQSHLDKARSLQDKTVTVPASPPK